MLSLCKAKRTRKCHYCGNKIFPHEYHLSMLNGWRGFIYFVGNQGTEFKKPRYENICINCMRFFLRQLETFNAMSIATDSEKAFKYRKIKKNSKLGKELQGYLLRSKLENKSLGLPEEILYPKRERYKTESKLRENYLRHRYMDRSRLSPKYTNLNELRNRRFKKI